MAEPSKKGERREGDRRQDKTRRDEIERNLKRVYDETLEEPLPEKLAELVERLRNRGRQ